MRFRTAVSFSLSTVCSIILWGCSEANESRAAEPAQQASTPARAVVVVPTATPAIQCTAATPIQRVSPRRSSTITSPISASRTAVDGLTAAIVEVSGQVQQPDGSPAPNATVELMEHQPGIGRSLTITTTRTDSLGRFTLRGGDRSNLALKASGEFPTAYLQLIATLTHYNGEPVLRKLEYNLKLEESHTLIGKVLDATGTGLANVPVHLLPSFKRTPAENLTDLRPRETRQTTTTEDGSFTFDHLSQGVWIVGAKTDDAVPVTIPVTLPTSETATIKLSAKGATAQGQVLHKFTNQPLANIPVFLGSGDMNQLSELHAQQTTTTADGRFRFDNLSTGPLRLYTDASTQGLHMIIPRHGVLQLADGETTDINIFLYPGHSIYGKVIDKKTKAPIAGATIETHSSTQRDPVTTVSDAQGNYGIDGIVPYDQLEISIETKHERYQLDNGRPQDFDGPVRVSLPLDGSPVNQDLFMVEKLPVSGRVVTADNKPVASAKVRYMGSTDMFAEPTAINPDGSFTVYAPQFSNGGIEAAADEFTTNVLTPVNTANQPLSGLTIELTPGLQLEGTVTDTLGKPIQGAQVDVTRKFGNFHFQEHGTISDTTGTFSFSNLPRNVQLMAKKEGYEYSIQDVALNPGEVPNRVSLVLADLDTGFIAGTVEKSDGSPASRVSISVLPKGSGHAVSQSDGTFEINNLKQGRHDLEINHNRDHTIRSVPTGTDDLRVILKAQPPRETGNFTLEGTVIDDMTSKPVDDYSISGIERFQPVKQNQPSSFKLTLPAKTRFTLKMSSPDHPESIHITESGKVGETVKQVFRLGKPGGITGRLVDGMTSAPMSNVTVMCMGTEMYGRYGDDPKADTVTSADGKFMLADVPNGRNKIIFLLPEPYAPLSMEVDVNSGKVTDLQDVKTREGGDIFGQVVRGQQKSPVAGVEVQVRSRTNDADFEKTVVTDHEGRFDIAGLKEARYEITMGNFRTRYELKQSEVKDILVQLGNTKVTGTATEGSKPYQGWIYLRSAQAEFLVHTRDGNYTLMDVLPGEYTLTISTESETIHKETITVPDQPEFRKDIQIASGRIKVIITDESGWPVPGVMMDLAGDPLTAIGQHSLPSKPTSPEGIYTFMNLAPGTYTLTVGTPTQRGQGIQQVIVEDGGNPGD